ncbi:short chain dehydrogenase [Gigaspora rosea]|uniref:Short chain dehydrogenase n=1 Tax=Gigaspora rosea TaxID=44941 RepID=A0A397VIP5_9GLOM|nr:short chain dehydrogenase [Gigaspora rosea]
MKFIYHQSARRWNPKEKVVIITGASSGIGESLAYQFSRHGCILVLCARREALLAEVSKNCKLHGAKDVISVKVDVTKESEITTLIQQIEKEYNRIDCLILNAGISMGERLDEINDFNLIRKLMEVNYFGSTNFVYQALPLLKRSPKSRIVVVSSAAGLVGAPLRTGYCGSKFALRGFFTALACELSDNDIYVTMAYPGPVKTQINNARLGKDPHELDTSNAITPEKCAQIIYEATLNGDMEVLFETLGRAVRIMEGPFLYLNYWFVNKVQRNLNKNKRKK